jgi:hypothetical protein
LKIAIKDSSIGFNVEFIDLYLFPYEIGMFSLKINLLEKENLNLGIISDFSNKIRNLSTEISFNNQTQTLKKFTEENVLHVIEQNANWDIYNPQLKSFILIDIEGEYSQTELDNILFDIGNVSPIGSAKGNSMFSPSEDYYKEQIAKNRISVFNNWGALSLFDTFTRISVNFPDKFKSWEYDYFNIYIHCLYVKFYMYLINTELSDITKSSKRTQILRDNFIEFINDYHHTQISYKFLPDLIRDKLMDSLAIHAEIERMETKVKRINEFFQEKREKTMNTVLIMITFLSVISMIYDLSTWIARSGVNEKTMFPLGSVIIGGSIFAAIIMFFLFRRK